jgi:DNA-binding transcriptional LysR family regulator
VIAVATQSTWTRPLKNSFRSLDLNLLRVFALLMTEGNVTRAAHRLALSQSAVSNALARLRRALDDPLFEKVPTGVRATDKARELWLALEPHYAAIQHAIAPERFVAQEHNGSFTIAMSDYTAERIMPKLSANLALCSPGTRVDVVPYSVTNLNHMLEREGVDFAIGTYLSEATSTRGLRTHFLWSIHLSCLMRRDHPLSTGRLTRDRFLAARHVDVRLPGMSAPIYDSVLATYGLQRNLVISLNHYNQALAVIAGADYIGVLPTSLLDHSPFADALVTRVPPIPMPIRSLGITWHRRSEANPAHQWLRTSMIALFSGAGR